MPVIDTPIANSPATPQNAPQNIPGPPTPQPTIESPAEGNVDGAMANPEATPSPTPEAPQDRAARALARKQREAVQAREQASKAHQERDAARKEADEARKAVQELTDLINGAGKDRSTAMALLNKAGIRNEDDLARILIGIDPKQPSADEKLAALEKRLAEKEAAETKARQEATDAHEKAVREVNIQKHLRFVHDQLNKTPEAYELINANAAYPQVLERAYAYLRENRFDPTPEQEVTIVKYFADELETALTEQATYAQQALSKIKKLGGIAIKPNDNQSTIPATDSGEAIATPTMRAPRVSKFITNESTISNRPIPADHSRGHRGSDADLIQEAVKAMKAARQSQ